MSPHSLFGSLQPWPLTVGLVNGSVSAKVHSEPSTLEGAMSSTHHEAPLDRQTGALAQRVSYSGSKGLKGSGFIFTMLFKVQK